MKSIEPLPESVHNSLRSTSIVFDLTRVVEELIFNSLDAGAKNVSVNLGITTCFVKVVDDGSGITRDGLVLVGERYATSKPYNSNDMDVASRFFGFRGEALSSISDVSLLEIVTKAHGRPNGFRKIMKDCTCLYLGIDDERQDVGTIVIVRDLFYNRPVRRKQMQSSPRKVLDSVKKCVIRIALVHSKVSFEVVDVESQEELLHAHPSASPLLLLMSSFGIKISNSLHEINLSDGVLKLTGYVSGSYNTSFIKGLEYVYINSRFVRKGPIHKLLNVLANRFNNAYLSRSFIGSENVKRIKAQASPAYILNICCPRSWYHLAFEPLKTSVEFKDWALILNFIEKAIVHLWGETMAQGETSNLTAHISKEGEIWREDDNIVRDEVFSTNRPAYSEIKKDTRILHSDAMDFLTNDEYCMSHSKDCSIKFRNLWKNTADLKGLPNEIGFGHPTECSFQFRDKYLAKCTSSSKQESDNHFWSQDNNCLSAKHDISTRQFSTAERSNGHSGDDDYIFDRMLETRLCKIDANPPSSASGGDGFYCDYIEDMERVDQHLKKSPSGGGLQNCNLRGNMLTNGNLCLTNEIFDYKTECFRAKRMRIDPNESIDVEADSNNERFDFLPNTHSSSRSVTKIGMHANMNFLSKDFFSLSSFDIENDMSTASVAQMGNFGFKGSNFEWWSETSNLLHETKGRDVQDFTCGNEYKWNSLSCTSFWHFVDRKYNCIHNDDFWQPLYSDRIHRSISTSVCKDSLGFACSKKENVEFIPAQRVDNIFDPRFCDILKDEADMLCSDLWDAGNTTNCAVSPHHIPSSIFYNKNEYEKAHLKCEGHEQNYVYKLREKRSCSAPPFVRGKKRFFDVNNYRSLKAEEPNTDSTLTETSKLNHLGVPLSTSQNAESCFEEEFLYHTRHVMKNVQNRSSDMKGIKKMKLLDGPNCYQSDRVCSDEDFGSEKIQDSVHSGVKWRFGISPTASGDKSHDIHDQCNILNISSGILHASGYSLIPESIKKNYLEDAKVLPQVDKKFIPVVSCGILAVIDQHAADERIRLEDLRQKVLSGKMKTITYLDDVQELALPAIGYQLLQNYVEQIQSWGWICEDHSHSSRSFSMNLNLLHRKQTVSKLIAVPCILGVNLSEADLLEFLQQLADTDGSSTVPPSVLRVLNSKACRGAIMFGDALLLSECSLIVDELKRTSLCFQCAHGRPTTVPLVNLVTLHEHINSLEVNRSNEPWHGLKRHSLSLKRATNRFGLSKSCLTRNQCSF